MSATIYFQYPTTYAEYTARTNEHVWTPMCFHLHHAHSYARTHEYLGSSMNTHGLLWAFVNHMNNCEQLWTKLSAHKNTFEQLWTHMNTIEQQWTHINTREHLWATQNTHIGIYVWASMSNSKAVLSEPVSMALQVLRDIMAVPSPVTTLWCHHLWHHYGAIKYIDAIIRTMILCHCRTMTLCRLHRPPLQERGRTGRGGGPARPTHINRQEISIATGECGDDTVCWWWCNWIRGSRIDWRNHMPKCMGNIVR